MAVSSEDVQRLVQVLDADRYDSLSVDDGDLRIEVERLPQSKAQPGKATAAPVATAAVTSGPLRVTAPAVGRLRWHQGEPTVGAEVTAETVLGYVEAGGLRTNILAGSVGWITYVRPVKEGDFVEYGQWLLVLELTAA